MPLKSLILLFALILSACGGDIPEGGTTYGHFSSDIPGLTAAYAATAAAKLERSCAAGSTGGAAAVRVTAQTTELGLINSRITHVRTC